MNHLDEPVRHDRWSMLYLLTFLIGIVGTALFIADNWIGSIDWINDAIGISSILCLFAFRAFKRIKGHG